MKRVGFGDRAPAAGDAGTVSLLLDLHCREGQAPVCAILSFPRHPKDAPAERFLVDPLRNQWHGLVGDKPVF